MQDFLFGLLLSISVGPIALLIVDYAIRGGIAAGLFAGFGAAAADGVYALVALTIGKGVSPLLSEHMTLIRMLGCVVLVMVGLRMFVLSFSKIEVESNQFLKSNPSRTVFFMTLSNPLTILVFLGYMVTGTSSKEGGATVLLLFFGSLLGQSIFAAGGAVVRAILRSRQSILIIRVLSSIGVIFYGVVGLVR